MKVKGRVYVALVLSILLYGSEGWGDLRAALVTKLATFHHRCARHMYGITRRDVWKRHITTRVVLDSVGLRSVEGYLHTRLMTWAGHVARMSHTRLPRNILFSWINHPRPAGGQQMNYGRRLWKALGRDNDFVHAFGEGHSKANWVDAAQDRGRWRSFAARTPTKPKSRRPATII